MPDGRIMMSDGTTMSARHYQDGNMRPELAQLRPEAQHTTEADALSDLVDRDEPPQA
ncbi:MAG: hypothetical protein ACK41Y_15955 [Paracoccus hibiscisoli]|uniref:hypothetical protein n=1 Tax=Paracoccus hibiscisoli TaxID=2023261 RepID=UPI00391B5386